MTAVVVAMLGIVIVATVVLGVVGGYHHFLHSRRTQRRIRRMRYVARSRARGAQGRFILGLCALRRSLAGRPNPPRVVTAMVRRALPH